MEAKIAKSLRHIQSLDCFLLTSCLVNPSEAWELECCLDGDAFVFGLELQNTN